MAFRTYATNTNCGFRSPWALSHVIFAAGIFLLTRWGKILLQFSRHHLRLIQAHHRNGFNKCKLNMLLIKPGVTCTLNKLLKPCVLNKLLMKP